MKDAAPLRAVQYRPGELRLLDQRRLPGREVYRSVTSWRDTCGAIRDLTVRGAPAIGLTAAYGLVLAAEEADRSNLSRPCWLEELETAAAELGRARPTAVNLVWAVAQLMSVARSGGGTGELRRRADGLLAQDIAANRAMGEYGGRLLPAGARVLTHCNAGALATAGYGTALGVVRWAWEHATLARVYATETRPVLQGARLTAWELGRDGIPVSLLVDGAAALLMGRGEIDAVVVGADRIAANGDVANKIGTYGLAIAAGYHDVPFYVAAPLATVDPDTGSGSLIEIEQRPAAEVTDLGGRRIAARGVAVCNPAFDVTPAALVTAIVTEAGVLRAPYSESIARALDTRPGWRRSTEHAGH